jgi:hypothetical protein
MVSTILFVISIGALFYYSVEQYLIVFFVSGLGSYPIFALAHEKEKKSEQQEKDKLEVQNKRKKGKTY